MPKVDLKNYDYGEPAGFEKFKPKKGRKGENVDDILQPQGKPVRGGESSDKRTSGKWNKSFRPIRNGVGYSKKLPIYIRF